MKKKLLAVITWLTFSLNARAEPVTAVLAAIGTFATAGAAAGAAAVFAGAYTVASLAYTAYNTYSTYKQGQKAKDAQKRAALEARERNARQNFRSAVMAKRAVYGRERLGGGIIFAHNPTAKTAVMIVALADHEIEEIETVYLMDEVLTYPEGGGNVYGKYKNRIEIHPFLGKQDQDLSSLLQNLGCSNIATTDKFQGTACLVIRTTDLLVNFPDADVNFNSIVKGKNDIFDPRTNTKKWTDNAALCSADYAVSFMGWKQERINLAELSTSADVCDEVVNRKDGTPEKRYTVNGVITADQEHRSVLPDLAEAMAGNIAFVSGQWLFVAGRYNPPTVHFTADDVLAEFEYTYKKSEKDAPNIAKGTFKSPEHNWQSVAFPSIDETNEGEERVIDITLPFTNSYSMAQRIAKIQLRKSQMQESCALSLKPKALLVKTTDVAFFDIPRHGIEKKSFEVIDFAMQFGSGSNNGNFTASLTLVESRPEIYEYNSATDERNLELGSVDLGQVSSIGVSDINLIVLNMDYSATWVLPTSGNAREKLQTKITTNAGETIKDLPANTTSENFSLTDTYQEYEVRVHYADGTISPWVSP